MWRSVQNFAAHQNDIRSQTLMFIILFKHLIFCTEYSTEFQNISYIDNSIKARSAKLVNLH